MTADRGALLWFCRRRNDDKSVRLEHLNTARRTNKFVNTTSEGSHLASQIKLRKTGDGARFV